jgi:hypothetical protein
VGSSPTSGTIHTSCISPSAVLPSPDGNEEIALKNTNDFNEQYNIWTSGGYVRRSYITTCFPAQF